ncbi:hypothetical protein Mapa_016926 [Marchantia paleacea]|nr:hypothetical protein Mapa_016926 [Marchantia paleacea]
MLCISRLSYKNSWSRMAAIRLSTQTTPALLTPSVCILPLLTGPTPSQTSKQKRNLHNVFQLPLITIKHRAALHTGLLFEKSSVII